MFSKSALNQLHYGFTLVEMMVSIALSVTIMSGVVQMLVFNKNIFIMEHELATIQENARYVVRILADEIHMAGFTGCNSQALSYANSVKGSSGNWYLAGAGIQGFDYKAGRKSFPKEFRADILPNTDAIVIRRGDASGLRLTSMQNIASAVIPLASRHPYKSGQIMMITTPDCQQVGVFQLSGPGNASNTATSMEHAAGSSTQGNCTSNLAGNFSCNSLAASLALEYPSGSNLMALSSAAYYVGVSSNDAGVPTLHRERLLLNTNTHTIYTAAEELVQGVEYMQILYGFDADNNDNIPDIYVGADYPGLHWDKVKSVRLALRLRSALPVYNKKVNYPEFEQIKGSDGSDRFMRQLVETTITLRN
ncbi:MAG: PilW family protein [Pseudohongiellaceae bacterium]